MTHALSVIFEIVQFLQQLWKTIEPYLKLILKGLPQ
jgi:hypothetical protein